LQRLYKLLAQREEQAQQEARVDPLTGVANRKFLAERLEARRASCVDRNSVLCLLDLNHFKHVNDTRGHEGGDELLVSVARRLEAAVPEAFIARLGGDEFAILADVDGARHAEEVCLKIADVFASPFVLAQGECFTHGSVGATFLQRDLTVSELLRRADAAMYKAKTDSRSFKIFDEEMIEGMERRARLALDLRNASPSFPDCSAVYQPILGSDGSLEGLETLLRWKHPKLGQIPPAETVSVAEDVHLINELGLLVAKAACQAAQLFPDTLIAFNVSVMQLLDARFEESLRELVDREGVACGRLQIEIKEVDFAARGRDMAGAVRRLSNAGFKIAVDDFGSSTSSLVQLQRYGVTVLKLDPKVLRNAREVANITVMRANVELAKALGMVVVCEGVGVEADRTAAVNAGCDMMQGFLLGRPQELEAISKVSWMLKAA
jgi:diguanylate cyclase (GGDEF)-like protein